MDKQYHKFMNLLVEAEHPWPDVAVKRALFSKKKEGAGLTKIPLAIIQEDYTSKAEARQKYEDIDDDMMVEALYLADKDTVNEQTIGYENAVSFYYDDESASDIVKVQLPIKRTAEIPLVLTGGHDISNEFRGIMRAVNESFQDDVSRGYDHADRDRKRLTSRIRKLIEMVA